MRLHVWIDRRGPHFNILGAHFRSRFEACVAKATRANVGQILRPGEERAATKRRSSSFAFFLLAASKQFMEDPRGDPILFGRKNETEEDEMAEQNAPVGPE